MTNPYEDHHHISAGELGFLALLGAILTLPSAMLRRVLKRLAILVGGLVVSIAIIGGAYAVFTPAVPDCTAPLSLDRPFCKQPAAIPMSQRTKICKREFEDLYPGSNCHQP